jgi:CAAX prenyl protease-like protein
VDRNEQGTSGAFERCAPFGVFVAFLVAGSFVQQPWLVIVRSALVALLLAWFWPRYRELHAPGAVRPAQWGLAVACGLAVFGAWIFLDHEALSFARGAGFRPLLADGSVDWTLALLRLAGFALVVPVMEELFWRGFLLRWIDRHDFLALAPAAVGARAVLITSALFALEHSQWAAGVVAGVAYGLIYMRTGNLWVAVAAHATTNLALGAWILATRNWQFW